MSANTHSTFQAAMTVASRRVRLGKCAILAWIATSEGVMSARMQQRLRELTTADDNSSLNMALDALREPSAGDLAAAFRMVGELSIEERRVFLGEAISVAVADGKLRPPAHLILLFLAKVSQLDLIDRFVKIAGRPLPKLADPGAMEFWGLSIKPKAQPQRDQAERKTANQKPAGGGQQAQPKHTRPKQAQPKQSGAGAKTQQKNGSAQAEQEQKRKRRRRGMQRPEALSIMGLAEEASVQEIAATYRRLAITHHPDRFSQADDTVQREAARTFARINEAYQILSRE